MTFPAGTYQRLSEGIAWPPTPQGCLLWRKPNRYGYGRIGVVRPVRAYAHIGAHQLSWMLHRGPIPDGLCVLHRCDNRACVNPDHLFLGTKTDNARDRDIKNRQAKGTRVNTCKLSPAQVLEVRALAAAGAKYRTLGRQFGVSGTAIKYIVSRRNWRHLQ